jgi:transcriptional antiterminator RfaH
MLSLLPNQVASTAGEPPISQQPPFQWYLLQCKTQQQARSQMHLLNQGFQIYSPEHKVKRIVRGRPEIRVEALFPGYLFIQLNELSDWRALSSTRGVNKVVSFNGRPYPVPDALIEGLQQRFIQQTNPEPLFKAGQKVLITEGCFKHIEAIVKAVTADDRIIVLLNILHSQQSLQIPAAQLVKVG